MTAQPSDEPYPEDYPQAESGTQLAFLYAQLWRAGCKWGHDDDWQCPAHDDQNASLGVAQGSKGVVIHCSATCSPKEVLDALGTSWPVVLQHEPGDPASCKPGSSGGSGGGRKAKPIEELAEEHGGIVDRHSYKYLTPDGLLARTVYRWDFADGTKEIRQRLVSKTPAIYRQGMVTKAIAAGLPIYVVEGEKSADRLNAIAGKGADRKAVATTSPGGAGHWTDDHARLLAGADRVVIVADNDTAGFKHARDVFESLAHHGSGNVHLTAHCPTVVRSATDGKGDDLVDHVDAKFKIKELRPVDLDAVLAGADDEVEEDDAIIGLELPEVILREPSDVDPRSILWPPPTQPLEVAHKLAENITYGGIGKIRFWRDKWFYWTPQKGHYEEFEPKRFHGQISDILRGVKCHNSATPPEAVPWNPRSARVDEVLVFLRGLSDVIVPSTYRPGIQLSTDSKRQLLSLRNGVLDLARGSSMDLITPSPDWFTFSTLPFDYDPEAQCPRWEQFLTETWPDDPEAIALLQEWFGYVLSEDMHQEKFLSLYGLPQSGKTTIDNLLRELLGEDAVTSVTFTELGERFGKIGLDTKKLAITGDSRWSGKDNDAVVQTILSITGRSKISVEHKGVDKYTATPTARLMLISNERPALQDPQNALMRRLMILETRHACPLERRDPDLLDKLVAELPGILNWSLRGLQALRAAGRFTVPTSTADEIADIARSQSPIAAFIEDRCDLEGTAMVRCQDFCEAYREWRIEEGMVLPVSNEKIGRELRSRFANYIVKKRSGDPRKGEQVWVYRGVTVRPRNHKIGL